jgi:hypothetical protein
MFIILAPRQLLVPGFMTQLATKGKRLLPAATPTGQHNTSYLRARPIVDLKTTVFLLRPLFQSLSRNTCSALPDRG